MTADSIMLQVLLHGHSEGEIWGLAAHPERDTFVTGSDDGTVCVWDASAKVRPSDIHNHNHNHNHDMNRCAMHAREI